MAPLHDAAMEVRSELFSCVYLFVCLVVRVLLSMP